VLYFYANWKFFSERIPYEETQLVKIFGEEYEEYRRNTAIGIPFISNPISQPVHFSKNH